LEFEIAVITAILVSITAFFTVYGTLPLLMKFLHKNNLLVLDYHKTDKVLVPIPAGPSIIAGILASESVLFAFFPSNSILALLAATFIAFIIGLIDDKKTMGGWFKPLALIIAALPILLFGEYDTYLDFPIFGAVKIPILYIGVVILMTSLIGNTFNSIDVLNGVLSGFMIIASISLSISMLIVQSFMEDPNYIIVLASLPLIFISVSFYKFHKFPSKIFPGNSGSLTFGVIYASLAILGDIEIIAIIIILPAIINSFLFLSSVKKIIEHRHLKSSTTFGKDNKLHDSGIKDSPITLVRLILGDGPMGEKEIGYTIFKLTIFSASLGIFSAFLIGIL
jgi:UDP-N-acetylglucosamine--dolichyl-phosphate N-acetylglucosaminephosphotransferase